MDSTFQTNDGYWVKKKKNDENHAELKSIKIDLFLEMDTTFQTNDAYHVEILSFFQNKVFISIHYGCHVDKWADQSLGLISQCIQRIPR